MDTNTIEIYVRSKLATLLREKMPHQGILAGPGIAAIVLSHIWGRDIPIDRIDHYQDWTESDEELDVQGPMFYSIPSLHDSYHLLSQNGFWVLSSDTKGIITSHIIQRCQSNLGKDRTVILLYALALNAFGVGYDCYSKQIHFTPDFIEFTRSKQLRIQSPVLAQSLLDLFNYQRCYDCYINLEEEIELMSGFRRMADKLALKLAYDNSVSASGKLMYDDLKQELEPYCSLLGIEEPILPGLELQMGLQYQLMFKQRVEVEKYENVISPLLKNNAISLDSFVFSYFYNVFMRKCTSNVLKRRFRIAMKYTTTAYMVMIDPECLKYDFAEKHAQIIDRFNTLHYTCVKMLISLKHNIMDLFNAIRLIQIYANKNGNIIIGLIETHKRNILKLEDISLTSLDQLIETYRIDTGVSLLEKQVDLSKFEYSECVTELTTTSELELEGWKMDNCVGGYASMIKFDEGNTRIFHIYGPKPSTAAIYYDAESKNVSTEVYGVCNRIASSEHLIVTERLGSYLLDTLWDKTHLRYRA